MASRLFYCLCGRQSPQRMNYAEDGMRKLRIGKRRQMFTAETIEEARKFKSEIVAEYESVLRLMGTVTMEYSETLSAKKHLFAESKLKSIRRAVSEYLIRTARYQFSLLAALITRQSLCRV